MRPSPLPPVGVSGLSVYVPRPRVCLREWCGWTGQPFEKVERVVGRSFRIPAPHEDAYTMAASAALRLILAYEVDPNDIGFFALGTESSKDNAAGAVIVRGMVDRALERHGLPRLRRSCEVPEFKHACLGGVYALKAALRYVASDGAHMRAIVIASDIAEYERGSSGEQTQGAGAVAMLVDRRARLFSIDLGRAGSASAYRGPDFRKPMARYWAEPSGSARHRHHDYPVFSGKYSTFAYLDETMHAFDDLVRKHGVAAREYLGSLRAMFFHRPYALMPVQAAAFLWLRALASSAASSDADAAVLAELTSAAGVPLEALVAELRRKPDLFDDLIADREPRDPYPLTSAVATALRKSEGFGALLGDRMALGADKVADLGNLYTASLPAWLAAGFEDAVERRLDLTGQRMLAVGYGSGDAAEALPLAVLPGWEESARRIGFGEALKDRVTLAREQYEALHDGAAVDVAPASEGFRIAGVGSRSDAGFQDVGVDYYEYARAS